MPIRFVSCEECGAQFRVKKYKKPYIGMYKGNPVFHWHFECVRCGHIHTVRFYNVFVNTYFDRVMNLELSLILNRKDEEKYSELLREYEIAKRELDLVNEDVIKTLGRSE